MACRHVLVMDLVLIFCSCDFFEKLGSEKSHSQTVTGRALALSERLLATQLIKFPMPFEMYFMLSNSTYWRREGNVKCSKRIATENFSVV